MWGLPSGIWTSPISTSSVSWNQIISIAKTAACFLFPVDSYFVSVASWSIFPFIQGEGKFWKTCSNASSTWSTIDCPKESALLPTIWMRWAVKDCSTWMAWVVHHACWQWWPLAFLHQHSQNIASFQNQAKWLCNPSWSQDLKQLLQCNPLIIAAWISQICNCFPWIPTKYCVEG